ncbi:hypothetical protein [Microcoleus sp. FACHB-672]|uniref:hypothetical protein n=1 Tax=Microcoleus sp. FACHB-672 TaxID=2692825 RepID=UPI001681EB40|nr:hypothetical protein [Microcoleus sp. FACHB-672]MBD2041396.1 hypothetical protein [Microcoleus sp. FACHB-672]
MSKVSIFTLSRRNFLSGLALGTLSLLTKDLINPAIARADNLLSQNNSLVVEEYHIFVPSKIARVGGTQTFILRSGNTCLVRIIPRSKDNQEIIIQGQGQNQQDIIVTLHTLYDPQLRIDEQIHREIYYNTQFIEEASKAKCIAVCNKVENADYIDDLTTLDFLDYIIYSSKLETQIQERYKIASTNSRLLAIHREVESALAQSELTDIEKKLIQGTYAYVRAGEPVPDFKALTDLDTIVASSALPLELKQTYSIASANSRALTVDFILVKLINETQKLTAQQKANYLSVYQQVRDGETVEYQATLKSLDSFISNADVLENVKFVYALARQQDLDNAENFAETVDGVVQDARELKKQLEKAQSRGAAVVPKATRVLTHIGVETATGVSISSLSGAAATNATLAVLGGGSVASGGLGMLGGLAVATGGAALIGAAGLLSIALVSQMDSEDKTNLGIAVGTGTIAGAVTVLAAWTAASALGVTGTLSGAAAITATMSALGGLTVMTGGAALVASATAFLIWSFLKGGEKRDQSILSQLETRTYTLTEDPIPDSLGEFLQKNVHQKYNFDEGFSAPHIPLDKLSNALSTWLSPSRDEKVMALIDTSINDDGKNGLVFTNSRLCWKSNSISYDYLPKYFKEETNLASLLSQETQKDKLSKVKKIIDILSDENYKTDLSKLKDLLTIVSDKAELSELLSNDKYKSKLSKLKKVVDVLSNETHQTDVSKLTEAVNILSYEPELAKFLPAEIVSMLSDEKYKQDLSEMQEIVNTLYHENDKVELTRLLRQISQKYSVA